MNNAIEQALKIVRIFNRDFDDFEHLMQKHVNEKFVMVSKIFTAIEVRLSRLPIGEVCYYVCPKLESEDRLSTFPDNEGLKCYSFIYLVDNINVKR